MTTNIQNPHPYDVLGPDQVLDAVEALGFVTSARVFALNSYENRVYQIGLESGEFIIAKFYRPERWSDDQIQEEHDFAAELQALDLPVIAPLQIDGVSLQRCQIGSQAFRLALFPRIGGRAPDLEDADHLQMMGRFLGRVHRAGAQREFRARPALSVQRLAIDSREFLLSSDMIPISLRTAYDTLSRDLIARLQQAFAGRHDTLRLHGDCHPGNVLWHDDTPHFVDFDDAVSGPAVQDLWMLLSGDSAQRQIQLLDVIEGYEEFYSFDARELALIEPLRTLRLMHYAGWLARRWNDPAFPMSFPWFNTERYWAEHILELREQMAALDEPPLRLWP